MQKNSADFLCPLKHLADIFGGKWKLPLICILSDGGIPKRYSDIKRRLRGITGMMLSQSLRELEESGLVHREQYSENPPHHVEYSLTNKGKSALPFLTEAAKWAMNDIKAGGAEIFCEECRTSHSKDNISCD